MPLLRRFAVVVLLTALIGAATAADFVYRVEIDAPPPVRALLVEHLRIIALQENSQMNLDQLRRVYRQTPQEIEKLAATEGYFSPEITPSLEEKAGNWVARFVVHLGEPVRVTEVDIGFAGAVAETSEVNDALRRRLSGAWQLKQGKPFRQADWDAAKRGLLQPLLAERFPAARIVESEALVDAAARSAKLVVRVDSGPVFTFGKPEISGLERYSPSVVERLSPIIEGQEYRQETLLDFQQRLQATGYFATAIVTIDADPAAPGNVPVKVIVTEARSRRVSFGVGYSTDVGSRVSTEYQHANFLDQGWRLKSVLKFETRRQSLSGELLFPRTQTGYDDRLATALEHQDLQGETLRRAGVTATRARQRSGGIETGFSITYQYEEQTLLGAPGDTRKALAFNYSWTQRAVDDLLFPRDGYLINLQAGGAPKLFPNTANFARGYGRGSYFIPVGKQGVFILRGEGGVVVSQSRRDIPSDFLFRTGGDQSVRGYSYQSIGVKEGDAIVGGRALGVVSAEYAHYFTPQWGAAVFYDAGGATDSQRDFKLNHGYGIGARWKSPIGPLNLDLAYGQETREYRIHFSVGLAF